MSIGCTCCIKINFIDGEVLFLRIHSFHLLKWRKFYMVLWIFQMKLEQCKTLKVFFCGTVQLFAHFISCYRGMSLTSIDFLMCLGIYTYGELADNSEPGDYSERYRRELLTSVRGGARIWLSAVEGHRTTTLLPFGPWSRHPLQLWNKSLSSCCWRNRWSLPNPALPFSHYLFYSQTRPNQQH